MYADGAVALRLAAGDRPGDELVVIQGDRFDVHFECVDITGALANLGTYMYIIASTHMECVGC